MDFLRFNAFNTPFDYFYSTVERLYFSGSTTPSSSWVIVYSWVISFNSLSVSVLPSSSSMYLVELSYFSISS